MLTTIELRYRETNESHNVHTKGCTKSLTRPLINIFFLSELWEIPDLGKYDSLPIPQKTN